jgi:hypothetical protein
MYIWLKRLHILLMNDHYLGTKPDLLNDEMTKCLWECLPVISLVLLDRPLPSIPLLIYFAQVFDTCKITVSGNKMGYVTLLRERLAAKRQVDREQNRLR